MRILLHLVELDLPLGGHGYGFDDGFRAESDGDDKESGMPMPWIIAVVFLAVLTIGVLISLNPGVLAKLRAHAPKAVILAIIVAPLIGWTAFSRGEDEVEDLIVERWAAGLEGAPELVVSLGNKALNTLELTNGKRVVRVDCFGHDGELVLTGEQKWPFVYERGFDYAHAHQRVDRNQLEKIARCRVTGPRVRLEAGVQGALTR